MTSGAFLGESLTEVKLSEHPGKQIEILTRNSTYLVRPLPSVRELEQEAGWVTGVEVETTSSASYFDRNGPEDVRVLDRVVVGRRWKFGHQGATSFVEGIRITA